MCNEFQLRLDFGAGWWNYAGDVKAPFHWRMTASNRPLNQPFKPTNRVPPIRPVDPIDPAAGLEVVEMRWWLVPCFHKGPPPSVDHPDRAAFEKSRASAIQSGAWSLAPSLRTDRR